MPSLFVSDPEGYKKYAPTLSIIVFTLMIIAFIGGFFNKKTNDVADTAYIYDYNLHANFLTLKYKYRIGQEEYFGTHLISLDTFKYDPQKIFLLKPEVVFTIKDKQKSKLVLKQ